MVSKNVQSTTNALLLFPNRLMSQQPQQQQRQWGVTPPISTAPPTKRELELTEDLLKTLHEYGLFESEQEAQKR